jgi:XRE family aerobic/anaerobic benzoate catabolism transcriptional regulator
MPREDLQAAFGSAVRTVRTRRGLSQAALAALVEVERTYVADVERGNRNVTLLTIHRLADALEIGMGELLSEADRLAAEKPDTP